MAAKVYSAPKEIKQPNYSFNNRENWDSEEKQFVADLKTHLEQLGYKGKNFGEIIQFPVADGYAQYLVASMKPLALVHLPLGDAWDWQYAHLLTAKEVQQKIDHNKALEALFSKNK